MVPLLGHLTSRYHLKISNLVPKLSPRLCLNWTIERRESSNVPNSTDPKDKGAIEREEKDKSELQSKVTKNWLQPAQIQNENPDSLQPYVFQQITKIQNDSPIFSLDDAVSHLASRQQRSSHKYNKLCGLPNDFEYVARGVNNEDSVLHRFPEVTDFVIVGGGLVGSATAYYIKKLASRCVDVCVIDKDPYNPNNTSALSSGLISCQSKSQDISRVASLSKELIRALQYDISVTPEDFASIKYRPITHLILWPEGEIDEVLAAVAAQNEDFAFTEAKTPEEIEARFPFLKVSDSDVALCTHGNQDEALVDPVALRNLYRSLAHAHGANFCLGELIDFNTTHSASHAELTTTAISAALARVPATGELRNMNFASIILCCGHNTPFLENRIEMESYKRDCVEDLHFLRPKLRIQIMFHSLDTPVINFPVITDTDGSLLINEGHDGAFKYQLTIEESEKFLDMDYDRFIDMTLEEPFVNLYHKSDLFKNYFDDQIKPRLVRRIPTMADAEFDLALSGFESYNTRDGNPIIGMHPVYNTIMVCGGYGSRMVQFAPAAGLSLAEFAVFDQELTFDMTQFYWSRAFKGRKLQEFKSLIS